MRSRILRAALIFAALALLSNPIAFTSPAGEPAAAPATGRPKADLKDVETPRNGQRVTDDEELSETTPSRPSRRSSTPGVSFGGGHYVIHEDEYHQGDMVLFGGSVEVRGEVTGGLVLFGAQATVSGTVRKEMVGIASKIQLLDGAEIRNDLTNVFGRIEKADGARIAKDYVDVSFIDLSSFTHGGSIIAFLLCLMFWIKVLKAAGLLLAVVILFAVFSERLTFAASVLPTALAKSFFFGLLAWVATILAAIILSITLVGFPFAIFLFLGFKLVWWAGIAAVCCLIGQRATSGVFGREVSAFAATLVGFLLLVVVYFVPLFGGLMMGVVGVIGLGLLTITRLGTKLPGQVLPLAPTVSPPPQPPSPAAPRNRPGTFESSNEGGGA